MSGSPSEIATLIKDSSGRIWAGTMHEVLCFDGRHFYSLREAGFPDSYVRELAEDDQGALWIASLSGLYRFDHGHVGLVLSGAANSVGFVASGLMVAAVGPPGPAPYSPGLYRLKRSLGKWIPEKLPELHNGPFITVDKQGAVLFAIRGGWVELSRATLTGWREGQALAVSTHKNERITAERVLRDQQGCIWQRNELYAAFQCPGDKAFRLLSPRVAGANGMSIIRESKDGRVILPSDVSLAIGRPESFQIAASANGLPNASDTILEADGSIWIGSARGLFRMQWPFNMEFWNERDGLSGVASVLHTKAEIYAADAGGVKVLAQDRRNWSRLPRLPDYGGARQVIEAANHTLLMALDLHGAAQIRTDGSVVAKPPNRMQTGARVIKTPDGTVWLAGYPVERVSRKGSALYFERVPLPGNPFNGLDEEVDQDGNLWVCYEEGLARLNHEGWRFLASKKDGLLQNACRSIAIDKELGVWYGYNTLPAFSHITFADGIPHLKHFRTSEGVGDASVHFLDFDSRGWLWRGAGDGVYVADAQSAQKGQWVHLGADEGLTALNTNQQAFYDDPDGSVWFAAETSVTHFSPPKHLLAKRIPHISVSGLQIDGNDPRLLETVNAIPDGSQVTALIGSLPFQTGLNVRYRFGLGEGAWRESSKLELPLGKVRWGSPSLEVQARYGGGEWSNVRRQSFQVGRPFWVGGWFLASITALFAGGIVGFIAKRRTAGTTQDLPSLDGWRMAAITPEHFQGEVLDGRYQLDQLLARGGFSFVFLARDLVNNDRCAVKVFRPEVDNGTWAREQFRQEVAALQRMSHPHVVHILAHGNTKEGAPYLVMEYVKGLSLREMLAGKPLPAWQTIVFLRQLGAALDEIHRHGIYHRDVKPENLMVRQNGSQSSIIIIDFSIALVQDRNQTVRGISRAAGTIDYMAPEQALGYADQATDIYSLAKVTVEILTGRPLSELLPDAALDLPLRLREFCESTGVQLTQDGVSLLCEALEFDPSRRPHKAGEFCDKIADSIRHAAGHWA